MSVSEDPGLVDQTTRTLQIIIGALTSGPTVFLLIVLLAIGPPKPKAPEGAPPGEPLPVLSVAALTFAVIAVPLSLVIPRVVSDAARQRIAAGKWTAGPNRPSAPTDLGKLATVYTTRKIIGAALNEGVAFFAVIAYMLERGPIALVLAVALIAGVALRFPFRPGVEQWLDDQLVRLQLERQGITGL